MDHLLGNLPLDNPPPAVRNASAGVAFSGPVLSDRSAIRDVDWQALMRIENLQLRAQHLADGFRMGLHRSLRQGFSAEFSEYRPYVVGEEVRYIDWRVFARSDRYVVKRFDEETNRRVFLVVDLSRSMDFGTLAYTKRDYAQTLAATLSRFLWQQRDAVGVVTYADRLLDAVPARYRIGQWRHILATLARRAQGKATVVQGWIETIGPLLRKRALVVWMSDFLLPPSELERPWSSLRAMGHELAAFHLFDPAERDLQGMSPGILEDLESGVRLPIDPGKAAATYRTAWNAHVAALQRLALAYRLDWITCDTVRPVPDVLHEWLLHRHARNRATRAVLRSPRPTRSRR